MLTVRVRSPAFHVSQCHGLQTLDFYRTESRDADSVVLRCLKHRHGRPVDSRLRFDRALQRA